MFLLTYSFLCLSYSAVDAFSVFLIYCTVHLCCSLNLSVLVKQFLCLLGLCFHLLPETLYHLYCHDSEFTAGRLPVSTPLSVSSGFYLSLHLECVSLLPCSNALGLRSALPRLQACGSCCGVCLGGPGRPRALAAPGGRGWHPPTLGGARRDPLWARPRQCVRGSAALGGTPDGLWLRGGLRPLSAGCLAWGTAALEAAGSWAGSELCAQTVASERAHADEYSREPLPLASLPHREHQLTLPPQETLHSHRCGGPGSCGVTALPGSQRP